jgi:hypothetical protein
MLQWPKAAHASIHSSYELIIEKNVHAALTPRAIALPS